MMSEPELLELGQDILKRGLLEGIALFDGQLLDGRNRLDAMEKANVRLVVDGQLDRNIPHRNVNGCDPFAYVLSKNIHRRHLTNEQRLELISKLVTATPEKSDRQIAEQAKASPTTVGKIRKKLETTGRVSTVDTRTDKGGRKQAAHKPSTTRPSRSAAIAAAADRAEARRAAEQKPQPAPEPAAEPDELVKLRADLADAKMIRDQALLGWRQALQAHDGFWTRKQFEDVRFCLHPDTYDQADPERRKRAWNLINMRKILEIKNREREEELPRPSPLTINDLIALQRQKDAERKAKRAARRKKPSAPPPPPPPAIEERVQHQPADVIIADTPDRSAAP
jgi:hypothetical protein